MKFSTAAAIAANILAIGVVADFDLWETNFGFVTGGNSNGEANVSVFEILLTQPYINPDDAVCRGSPHPGATPGSPYCDKEFWFVQAGSCAILRNCRANGEPHLVRDGEFFADLEDCSGGNRGTCYAWHTGYSTKTCGWAEAGRISYSRVACKTAWFDGAKA